MKSTRTNLIRRDENVDPIEPTRAEIRVEQKARRRANKEALHEKLQELKATRKLEGFVRQHERREASAAEEGFER